MRDKILLKNEIQDLKKEVQSIIDRKKGVTNIKEVRELDTVKKAKLGRLKRLSKQLKDIYAEEKSQKDIKITSNMVDSIEFGAAKKTKTQQAMEKAKKNRQNREEAKQKYLDYVEMENKYLERDPPDAPGMFFLHESVLSKYNLCPYIEINLNSEDDIKVIQSQTYEKRKAWLEEQDDKGALYYELYKKVFLQYELEALKDKKIKTEVELEKQLKDFFSESQYNIYLELLDLLEEYNTCPIKTKRVKEKFKIFIQKISILFAETLLPVHEYLGLKTGNTNVMSINEYDINIKIAKQYTYARQMFTELLESYKHILEEIEEKQKYNTNTIRNLKTELYLFLTKQKLYMSYDKPANGFQIGKYFTRWNNLSVEEKNERFESFAEFYVDRYIARQHLTNLQEKPLVVEKVANLLKESYHSKQMIYRDFAWKTKKGLIEAVHTLRYDKETNEFFLARVKIDGKVKMVKKRASTKTILTKENLRFINEIMLTFILDNKDELTAIEEKHVTSCVEKIKEKLRIKKVLVQDKTEIQKKLMEIYDIVESNKN